MRGDLVAGIVGFLDRSLLAINTPVESPSDKKGSFGSTSSQGVDQF